MSGALDLLPAAKPWASRRDDWAAFLAALAGIALGVTQVALWLSARFGARRVIPVGMALAVPRLA